MMLPKKTRSPHEELTRKNQRMTDSVSESSVDSDAGRRTRGNSLFSLPSLFVGVTKGSPDSDPSRSPTSPLDSRVFSGLGSYLARSPRSPDPNGPRWDCEPVRLGLLDALDDESTTPCGRVQGSSGSRNILLGSQMRIHSREFKASFDRLLAAEKGSSASPRSLPKNYVISFQARMASPLNLRWGSPETGAELPGVPFELGEPGKIPSFSADVDRLFLGRKNLPSSGVLRMSPFARGLNNGSSSASLPISHGFVGSLSASDIEQSEDYTCVISRGPNPKTTHIFGDCILESYASDSSDSSTDKQKENGRGTSWMVTCPEDPMGVSFPSEDFLRACYSCKKKLEGKDVYMYRGEKAFCSCSCRSQEIMEEEGMEEPVTAPHSSPGSSFYEDIFLPGIDFSTLGTENCDTPPIPIRLNSLFI